jgi:hypothetical protein
MEFKVHHRTVLHLSLANSFFFLQLYPFPPSIGGHTQCKNEVLADKRRKKNFKVLISHA